MDDRRGRTPSRFRSHAILAYNSIDFRQSRAVNWQINRRKSTALRERKATVVVGRTEHHDLANRGAVLFSEILVHTPLEGVGLDNALTRRALWDLEELSYRQSLVG